MKTVTFRQLIPQDVIVPPLPATYPLPAAHLDSTRLLSAGSAEIFELTGRSQPQMACQKYWELVHRSTFEGAMQHPNQYFEESRKTFSGTRGKTDRGEGTGEAEGRRGKAERRDGHGEG